MLKYFIKAAGSASSDQLRRLGPLVPGWIAKDSWNGTGPREDGYFAIDTLGPGLGVDEDIAKSVGKFVRTVPYVVSGMTERSVYSVKFGLPVNLTSQREGEIFAFSMPAEATAISGLQNMYSSSGKRVIGTLGRTFLQFCEFSYNGLTGSVEMLIDDSVSQPRPAA
jgi:hypothetical protein